MNILSAVMKSTMCRTQYAGRLSHVITRMTSVRMTSIVGPCVDFYEVPNVYLEERLDHFGNAAFMRLPKTPKQHPTSVLYFPLYDDLQWLLLELAYLDKHLSRCENENLRCRG